MNTHSRINENRIFFLRKTEHLQVKKNFYTNYHFSSLFTVRRAFRKMCQPPTYFGWNKHHPLPCPVQPHQRPLQKTFTTKYSRSFPRAILFKEVIRLNRNAPSVRLNKYTRTPRMWYLLCTSQPPLPPLVQPSSPLVVRCIRHAVALAQ